MTATGRQRENYCWSEKTSFQNGDTVEIFLEPAKPGRLPASGTRERASKGGNTRKEGRIIPEGLSETQAGRWTTKK